jgi:hypothetical protein
MANIVDLTKISVRLKLEFDTLDAILLLTTGGLGYLARTVYRHFDGKAARDVQLQSENLESLLTEAQQKGANMVIARVHPAVPLYAPSGGQIRYLDKTPSYNEVEFTLG